MATSSSPQHELALLVESEIPLEIAGSPPPDDASIAARMALVKQDLFRHAGGEGSFAAKLGDILRAAVDYVIDAPTLSRYSVDELEPDEKTAAGKRIERLIRFHFKIQRGKKLDITLAGEDVDIKTTMGKNWMFSKSSHDRINLLIAYDEEAATFSVGLAFVREDQLNPIPNRDKKSTLSRRHKANISWILKDQPYKPNLLAHLPEAKLKKITSQKTGLSRVFELFRIVQGSAIPRHVICSVANQKDPMRRVRSNGGARDVLWAEQILVLSGTYKCDSEIANRALRISLQKDEMLALPCNDSRLTAAMVNSYCAAHNLA